MRIEAVGPNLSNMEKVLGRIQAIQEAYMPKTEAERVHGSRFVDVLDEIQKKTATAERTSWEDMKELIGRAAEEHNIDEELIRALIEVESGWKPRAVSSKGARGLMQLMPRTAAMLGVNDPFDPEQNIEGGVKYLSNLTDKYKGDIELALAAYNAGSGRIDSGKTPSSTSRYVDNIMALYHRFREGR